MVHPVMRCLQAIHAGHVVARSYGDLGFSSGSGRGGAYPITDVLIFLNDVVTAIVEIKTHNALKMMRFDPEGDSAEHLTRRGTFDNLQDLPGLAMKFNYPATDKPKQAKSSQTKILLQVCKHVLSKDYILTNTVGRFGNKCIATERIFRFYRRTNKWFSFTESTEAIRCTCHTATRVMTHPYCIFLPTSHAQAALLPEVS